MDYIEQIHVIMFGHYFADVDTFNFILDHHVEGEKKRFHFCAHTRTPTLWDWRIYTLPIF